LTEVIARDALTIFVAGGEVPSLIAYGLSRSDELREMEFPADVWPTSPDHSDFVLRGDNWCVYGWEIPMARWPAGIDFKDAVRRTLEALISGGCRVAWIGAEGVPYCDPPDLFSPNWMSGGVLAAMTEDGVFTCPLDPDRVLAALSDDEMLRLRAFAEGLADA